MKQNFLIAIAFILISPTLNQQVLTNIPFECKGRVSGFWRDSRYCDVFHACVGGIQQRSYGCPQVGERFFFDESTQRCEFASRNTGGCQTNQYYTSVTNSSAVNGSQFSTQTPSEPWKIFIQSREQYNCASRQDGFYASRWCNVFYRCFGGVSNAFLCPLQPGGGRLWWIQHGMSQVVPEESAACAYPCETGRQCSSAGGILVENGNQISESQQEAETAYRQSSCYNQTAQANQTGAFIVDSDVSCSGQVNGTFLSSRYCNAFHQCISGSRFDFRCAPVNSLGYDLWWNQQTKLCDWPCRVQCNNQLYQSSMSAQQVYNDNLIFFNNDCQDYSPVPNRNK